MSGDGPGRARLSQFDVCVVGSANLDLVARCERIPEPGETLLGSDYSEHPGGKGLNQAVAAARSGARTTFVGAVGFDAAAEQLTGVMRADFIDISQLASVAEPTGRALISVSAAGDNSIIVVPGANAHVTGERAPLAQVLLCQLEVPLDAVRTAMTDARAGGSTVVLNPAPARPLGDDLLSLCDVVVPNEHEVELLGGVEHLLALGARAVVVTLGARGALLHTADGATPIAPYRVTPVDTTGAGDAFCGALAARLAAGDELAEALPYASAAGALATTVEGAVPSIAHADAIRHLMAAAD
jgi:ribokinase